MEFSLLHAGLAAGASLAAIPILIHLFQRQTPKRVAFPALRLIRERSRQTTKRLRIKNWLLLLARMALIALMALALARPTLSTQAPLGDEEVPTAMGLVFDTSLSMQNQEKGKDRLEAAKELAKDLLGKTPDESQVFVIDSAEPAAPPAMSPMAALKRIEGLKIRPSSRSLNEATSQAYAAIAESDLPRHEVFVLTDLARSAWDLGRQPTEKDRQRQEEKDIATFVFQLNPEEVRNTSVLEAGPTTVATEGTPIPISVRLRNVGPAQRKTLDLIVDGVRREQKDVELPADGEAALQFLIPKTAVSAGLHQGEVRITDSTDSMTFDDAFWFTFKAAAPLKILVVSDLRLDANFIANALEPAGLKETDPHPYRVERRLTAKGPLPDAQGLSGYAAVFLNNVTALPEASWNALAAYLRKGGGVVVGLGDRCDVANYNGAAAQQVLALTLDKAEKAQAPLTFGKLESSHPLFQQYANELASALGDVPIYRRWVVTPGAAMSAILGYSDNAPALLERTFAGAATGRCLVWTTPLTRQNNPEDPKAWNDFPVKNWTFVYLMDQTVFYFSGAAAEVLNYRSGEDVILRLPAELRGSTFRVQGPGESQSFPLNPPEGGLLPVVGARELGAWSVTPSGGEKKPGQDLGFSVNAPQKESEWAPAKPEDLKGVIGEDRFALASDAESLQRATSQRRIGHEMFPWLMVFILLLVTMENLLANTFYRQPGELEGAAPTRQPVPAQ